MAGKGRVENLIPQKKGNASLNPKGRPRKLPSLDKLLADILGTDGEQKSGMEKILRSLVQAATSGKLSASKVRAAEILLDRAFGKPKGDDTLKIKIPTPAEIAAGDAKANAVLEKYSLITREVKSKSEGI